MVRKLVWLCICNLVEYDRGIDQDGCWRRDMLCKVGPDGIWAPKSEGIEGRGWKWEFTPGVHRRSVIPHLEVFRTTSKKTSRKLKTRAMIEQGLR